MLEMIGIVVLIAIALFLLFGFGGEWLVLNPGYSWLDILGMFAGGLLCVVFFGLVTLPALRAAEKQKIDKQAEQKNATFEREVELELKRLRRKP